MTYKGSGDSSIHLTQLSCSAALLNAGLPVDEVVATLLAHTKKAACVHGARWNWGRRNATSLHVLRLASEASADR